MAGETGEVVEKVKKIIRDKDSIVGDEEREELKKEIGDVLWYVAALCSELGLDMQDVAEYNLNKTRDRVLRGMIKGEGDNR